MSVLPEQRGGTIRALNKDTGVIMEVRPDMLEQPAFNFEVLPDQHEHFAAFNKNNEELAKKPDVYMTKAGVPFKTEQAARTAFTANRLSAMEYEITSVDDGFIIAKVI